MLDGDNNEIENEQRAAEMLKLGVYSKEALEQAYVNIDQFDADKVEDMLKLADDSLIDVEYSQFVKQLQNHASSTPFKILKDLPRSLLSERQKMSEATLAETSKVMALSQAEMIEFALRFEDEDKSHDKLITVPSTTTIH